jgi:phenylacetate-CoA ligase
MTFGCKVYDQYGSREVSCIASECEYSNGLHISEETILLEIVDENGNECPVGVEGDVLVTSLVNYAMPIVRYKIGDRAIMESGFCKCGRSHKRLKNVVGRSMDNFKLRDGTIIPSEYFIHFIGVVLNRGILKKIQIIQRSYDLVDLYVVYSDEKILSEDVQNITQAVKKVMGKNCTVNIHEKKDIAVNSSGKFRYTICEL